MDHETGRTLGYSLAFPSTPQDDQAAPVASVFPFQPVIKPPASSPIANGSRSNRDGQPRLAPWSSAQQTMRIMLYLRSSHRG
jgi:hypothetical protein